MLMNKLWILPTILLLLQYSCKERTSYYSFNDASLNYTGRVELGKEKAAELYWPGTSIEVKFKGTDLNVLMKDERGQNYYNIIIDSDSPFILYTDSIKKWYTLASDLPFGEHSITLFKRTEWDQGKTSIYSFSSNGKLLPPEPKLERSIEFFGNSITTGYGNEDYSGGDSPDSIFTNNYMSYAAITARHFNADYHCTARGGIGILVSWFPLIMPDLYNRLDPLDPESLWDFKTYQPEIVVVNLFQNDSWLINMPEYPEFIHRFGTEKPSEETIIQAYKEFIISLRSVYPESKIICTLGSMDATMNDSPWPGFINSAVEELNDNNLYTCFFPYKNTPGHPKVEEHEAMAEVLIRFIENNIDW